jgi:DNA-binding GntR family transcriptional regulator
VTFQYIESVTQRTGEQQLPPTGDLLPSESGSPGGQQEVEQANPEAVVARYRFGAPPRGNTTDAVTDALREAILDGALSPSTWLREDELAASLQVSRTPVREALRRLADENIVVKTAHHGTVVASLTLEDALALYVVCENLEGAASRLAALRCTPELVDRLHESQRRMALAVDHADVSALVAENLTFHRILRTAAANPYLERFLTQVEHAVRRIPTTFAIPGRATRVLGEHQAIIDAISVGDGDAAEAAAKAHMHTAREMRLELMLGS